MFFTGALGALFMYSVLRSRDEHRRHSYGRHTNEHKPTDEDSTTQSISEQVAQSHTRQQEQAYSPTYAENISTQIATPPKVVYVPREVIREVVVDCSCKCVCKAPEKPDVPRSFWSLDQGMYVASARDREAKQTQEKRRMEIAKMTKYWSLDQGMHADVKASA